MSLKIPLYLIPPIILFRIFNALSLKTFFQPDEFYQSLEPAHILVYGYGYSTWEWREHLRSAAHPLLFSAVYFLADWLNIDLVLAPKIFQGVLASLADIYTYELAIQATNTSSTSIAKLALFLNLFSAFNWFCLPRTFSNSLETILTTIALSYWPWKNLTSPTNIPINYKRYLVSISIASITCIFRPTNGLLWLFLGIHFLYRTSSGSYKTTLKIITLTIITLVISFSINIYLDYLFYHELVFPIANFVKFNLIQSISQFYGTNQWHYYLTQGLPLLSIAYLPLILLEFYQSSSTIIVQLVLFIITTYSLLAHKEVRFIFPLMPLLHLLCAASLQRIKRRRIFPLRYLLSILVLINVPVAAYFSLYHQRGVIDVISYLHSNPSVTSVGFLMPCHSTPWQSHLHRPDINAWFLTCEPPIDLTPEQKSTYLDEADQFYADPILFLDTHLPATYNWPSHLVFFEALEPTIKNYLKDSYGEVSRCRGFLPPAAGLCPDP